MTRWLTGDEQEVWRQWLNLLSRQIEQFDADLLERVEISLLEYEILVFLSEADGHELRMSELARRLIVSRSNVTYRVDRMVARGLVARRTVAADRRGRVAVLLPAGLELLERAAPGHVETVRRLLFDRLAPTQLEDFAAIVERLAEAVEPTPT